MTTKRRFLYVALASLSFFPAFFISLFLVGVGRADQPYSLILLGCYVLSLVVVFGSWGYYENVVSRVDHRYRELLRTSGRLPTSCMLRALQATWGAPPWCYRRMMRRAEEDDRAWFARQGITIPIEGEAC
jgi:hypothetical protein